MCVCGDQKGITKKEKEKAFPTAWKSQWFAIPRRPRLWGSRDTKSRFHLHSWPHKAKSDLHLSMKTKDQSFTEEWEKAREMRRINPVTSGHLQHTKRPSLIGWK